MTKKITALFLFLMLVGCGFSPIYTSKSDLKFNLEILNSVGEKEINKYISNHIKKYTDKNLDEKIMIKIDTSYSKINISKDNKGSTTGYKLVSKTKFYISSNGKDENVFFTEKLTLNRFDDVFEEKRYETKLKEDIAILTVKKLIRHLKTKK